MAHKGGRENKFLTQEWRVRNIRLFFELSRDGQAQLSGIKQNLCMCLFVLICNMVELPTPLGTRRHPLLCSSALSHAWRAYPQSVFILVGIFIPGPWTSRRNPSNVIIYDTGILKMGFYEDSSPVHSFIEKYHLASLAGFINEDKQTNIASP